jgi:hypothetical protein
MDDQKEVDPAQGSTSKIPTRKSDHRIANRDDATPSKTVMANAYFAMIPECVLYNPDISGNAVRIYGALNRHANSEGQAFPSRSRLAKLCALSIRTVDKAIAELEAIDALVKQRRRSPEDNENEWRSNLYTVIFTSRAISTLGSEENNTVTSAGNSTRGSAGNSTLIRAITNQSHLEPEKIPASPDLLLTLGPSIENTSQAVAIIEPTFTAQNVMAAYCDEWQALHGTKALKRQIGQIVKAARELLQDGQPPEVVIAAAKKCAADGHANLSSSCAWITASSTRSGSERPTQRTQVFEKLLGRADQFEREDIRDVREIEASAL